MLLGLALGLPLSFLPGLLHFPFGLFLLLLNLLLGLSPLLFGFFRSFLSSLFSLFLLFLGFLLGLYPDVTGR